MPRLQVFKTFAEPKRISTMLVLSKRARRQPSARAIEIFRRHQILGETQRAIAKAMGCSAARVHQVCRYVSRWLAEHPIEPNIPAIRQQHDQTIRWLLAETLGAWNRSKQPAKTTKAKMVRGRLSKAGAPLPDLVTTEQIEQEQCGDPRFLQQADQFLRSQRAMWGADAPQKREYSGADGGPITLANVLTIIQENPPSPPAFIDPHPSNVIDVDSCAALIADPNFMPETIPEGGLRPVSDFGNTEVESAEALPDESPETDEGEPDDGESAGRESDDEPEEFVFR